MVITSRTRLSIFVLVAGMPTVAWAQGQPPWLDRIREEERNRSRVMDVASWLTDVHGPRLTGSPEARAAGDWVVAELATWGIKDAHLEPWAFTGRGWTSERFSAQVIAPLASPLIAYPQPWCAGTNGPVVAPVVRMQLDSLTDFDRYAGKLRGAWVMLRPPTTPGPHFQPDAKRWSQAELDSFALPVPERRPTSGQRPPMDTIAERRIRDVRARTNGFLAAEGIAGILWQAQGDDGTVFVEGSCPRGASPPRLPEIWVAAEHYGRIDRILEKGLPVSVEIDSRVRFTDGSSFNVIAELPGSDKRDEVVILGAHFDSWTSGTGATDNAGNCAVLLEALRILRATGLPLRRTVRVALWTGEEQYYLGSGAYVREHFGFVDKTGTHFTPEHARVSAYFNLDGGGGAIRGVHLQGNLAAASQFRDWFAALGDLGPFTVGPRSVGGSDNQVFDGIGLPSFAFMQDPLDYESRTHHSNMDVFERLLPGDLTRNAMIIAALAYQAANAPELMPRK